MLGWETSEEGGQKVRAEADAAHEEAEGVEGGGLGVGAQPIGSPDGQEGEVDDPEHD